VTPNKWERLKPLFDQALGLPREERAAFLEKVSREDKELGRNLAELAATDLETCPLDIPLIDLRQIISTEKHYFEENELILDRFRIVRFLGRGGMGEVYEADDLQLGRVALKTIRPEMAANRQNLLRFKKEVQLARRVTDSHVCRIHDLFTIPESAKRASTSFLTMEFLAGITLAQRIQREEPLPLPEAESVALQLCSALQAIHDSGIIHRDFKSNNVMLVPRNGSTHAIVMDLGLAREAEPAANGEAGLTMSGAVLGTPEYMAPEQFSGQKVTTATDIYALGVVLYEIVTGRRPFHAATPLAAAVMRAKMPSKASSIRPGLPSQWDQVINRCLEFEPEARWASASEVAEALTGGAVEGHRAAGSLVWLRRYAIAAILVVGIVLGFFWYQSHSYLRPSADAERWYQQGVAALREGTYFKATQALSRALQFDKDFALAHARLADAWGELDFTGKAKDEILTASSLEVRHGMPGIDRTYLDAVRAGLTFDYAAAVSDYRTILGRLPEAEKAYGYVDLGRAQEKATNLTDALKDYAEAARRAPEDPASFVHLGIVESRQGRTAEGESAFAKAEALYRAASNLEGTAEIAYQRGYAASLRGDASRARDYLAQSLRAAQEIPSVQLEIRALTRMSTVEYLADNTDQSISLANQSIQLARDNRVDYWAIDGMVRLGNAYLTRNDFAKAESPLREALRLASEGGRPRLAANSELSLASLRNMQERPAETIAYAQKALDYYKPAGFFSESTAALTLIVRSERDRAQFKHALSRALESLDIVRRMNNPASLLQAEESVGSVLLDLEQYPDALNHFQAALEAARSVHQLVEYQLIHCADTLWRLGRYAEAESMLSAIPREVAGRSGIKVTILLAKARMLLSRGNAEAALQEARLGLSDGRLPPESLAALAVVAGTAAAQSGASHVAESLCQNAYDHAQEGMLPAVMAQAQLCQAGAFLSVGAPQRALPLAESASKFFSSSDQQESEWRSLLYISKANKAAGDWEAARAGASRALEIISRTQREWGDAFRMYARRPDVMEARKELAESNQKKERLQK
jgi:protein kinase-like protein/tetratricopeptide repeat protein